MFTFMGLIFSLCILSFNIEEGCKYFGFCFFVLNQRCSMSIFVSFILQDSYNM